METSYFTFLQEAPDPWIQSPTCRCFLTLRKATKVGGTPSMHRLEPFWAILVRYHFRAQRIPRCIDFRARLKQHFWDKIALMFCPFQATPSGTVNSIRSVLSVQNGVSAKLGAKGNLRLRDLELQHRIEFWQSLCDPKKIYC